ncbi:hypothetical protein RHGRI_002904 [Rhododendron griersonianum]|uniref:V-type proton ATPase subunit F n=1 Tax=Rhododendron griersonianum TaxID=479676 RepID=A0AAV6LRT3_9ERIC|nr:hypothetical protein RHGRI_002904 [Rhododendron griersonianum]
MANKVQVPTRNSALIAMIADEDTITGFLLAGVGNVDLRRKTNYLIVDSKTTVKQIEEAFKEFTTREDIAIVMISQYVSCLYHFVIILFLCFPFMVTLDYPDDRMLCQTFNWPKEMLICGSRHLSVANMIRFLVDSYNKPVPAILEIPSKDHPYDPTHDSVLSRVKYLFSAESVASGKR